MSLAKYWRTSKECLIDKTFDVDKFVDVHRLQVFYKKIKATISIDEEKIVLIRNEDKCEEM